MDQSAAKKRNIRALCRAVSARKRKEQHAKGKRRRVWHKGYSNKVRDDRQLTDIVDRVLLGHMFCDTCHDVDCIVFEKEIASQLRVIAHENARVELSFVQPVSRILKEGLRKALEAKPLVHVAEFVKLRAMLVYS